MCFSQQKVLVSPLNANVKVRQRVGVVCMGMLAPRKFMQKRRKVEVFKDAADEADRKNWRRLMNKIEETGSAVAVLSSERTSGQPLPKDLVLGTLVRLKQQKKWNIVSEVVSSHSYFSLLYAYGSCVGRTFFLSIFGYLDIGYLFIWKGKIKFVVTELIK